MSAEFLWSLALGFIGIAFAVLQMMFPTIPWTIGWPIISGMAIASVICFIIGTRRHRKAKRIQQTSILPNRREFIGAVQTLRDASYGVIEASMILNEVRRQSKEPHSSLEADWFNAWNKYQESLKSVEHEALIAGDQYHGAINTYLGKVSACINNPIPPKREDPNATLTQLPTQENYTRLNDAMNEVVACINALVIPTFRK